MFVYPQSVMSLSIYVKFDQVADFQYLYIFYLLVKHGNIKST